MAVDFGFSDPNEFSNRIRTIVMNKPAIASGEDAEIYRALHRLNINPTEYTTTRPHEQVTYGPAMEFVDIEKSRKLAQANKELLTAMITENQKIALGLSTAKKVIH
jgi:hypothetical protein